jgi:hypothetical protein
MVCFVCVCACVLSRESRSIRVVLLTTTTPLAQSLSLSTYTHTHSQTALSDHEMAMRNHHNRHLQATIKPLPMMTVRFWDAKKKRESILFSNRCLGIPHHSHTHIYICKRCWNERALANNYSSLCHSKNKPPTKKSLAKWTRPNSESPRS